MAGMLEMAGMVQTVIFRIKTAVVVVLAAVLALVLVAMAAVELAHLLGTKAMNIRMVQSAAVAEQVPEMAVLAQKAVECAVTLEH